MHDALSRWAMCRAIAICALVCGLTGLRGAQAFRSAGPATDGYVEDAWQSDAGLPNNQVTSIVQTPDRYLWIGTSNGLARFDGVRFTTFRNPDNPELRSNRILCLQTDSDGVLWLGTQEGGLVGYGHGQFSALTAADGLSADTVLCLGTDASGALWAGTSSGLNRRLGGRLTTFFQTDGLPDDRVYALCRLRDSTSMFATGRGLCRFASGRLTILHNLELTPRLGVCSCLLEDRQGQVWVGGDGGLLMLTNATAKAPPGPAWLWEARVLALIERNNGEIWFGTAEGELRRVATDSRQSVLIWRFTAPVTALCEDVEKNLWVGTGGDGLHRLKRRQLRCLALEDGPAGTAPLTCFETPKGELELLTADSRLYRYRGGTFERLAQLQLPAGVKVQTACRAPSGELWIGTEGDGLYRCDEGAPELFSEREGLSGNTIDALYADSRGGLWIGTHNGGLNYLKGGVVKRFNTPWGFLGNFACAFAEDNQGSLWIGTTGDGLFQLAQGRFTAFSDTNGLPSDDVRSLHPDRDGVLWVGTARGLCRLKEGKVVPCTGRTGMPNEAVLQLRSDGHGNLWVGSSSSIYRVRKAQLNAFAEGQASFLDVVPYGREDGLPGLQCLPGAPSLIADQTPWFWTTRGLVVAAAGGLQWNDLPPTVILEQVLVENESVALADSLRIPPGKESLLFRFTCPSLTAPGKVGFRYRLEGFDRDWSEVTASRTARYPKVPPGSYAFHVVARNNDGVWSAAGANIALAVTPFWWETRWFQLGCAAGVVVVLGGFYRARRARRQELERLRVRIASDLHDDLGSSLWSITLLSRMLAKSRNLGQEEQQDVQEIHRIAVQTSNSIRDIIWLINPAFDSLQELILRTKDFAATLLRGTEYRVNTEGVDLSRKLPLDFRQNLFLFFKEALTNIAKHARATVVEARIEESPSQCRFTIRDNGVGFEPQNLTGGNGLRNLRTRAGQMGGTLELQSRPGGGTVIVLTTAWP